MILVLEYRKNNATLLKNCCIIHWILKGILVKIDKAPRLTLLMIMMDLGKLLNYLVVKKYLS